MSGGLVQMVAYGAQNVYLTSNPQITFFKSVYRRHTNFAMESINQTFNGNVAFGSEVTATISRNGDLIKDMWLEMTVSNLNRPVYGLGNAIVKQAELHIGGMLIDKHYGEWLDIWSELTVPAGRRACYDEMVGNVPLRNANTANTGLFNAGLADADTGVTSSQSLHLPPTGDAGGTTGHVLDVPLMFWFNRNPGLALPLIALQYHEVKLKLVFESAANLDNSPNGVPTLDSCNLWVDYIFLDTDERRRFAQVSHEYLFEQLQFTGDDTITNGRLNNVTLNLNHPVKALYFVGQANSTKRGGTNATTQPCKFVRLTFDTCKLQLNSHDRFTERRPEYFLNVQPFKHHTHCPRSDRVTTMAVTADLDTNSSGTTDVETVPVVQTNSQYIYMYSFALHPEELQPSGTCNFSRIDNAVLRFTGDVLPGTQSGVLKVFALSYNVLRIMSGMAGVAYAN